MNSVFYHSDEKAMKRSIAWNGLKKIDSFGEGRMSKMYLFVSSSIHVFICLIELRLAALLVHSLPLGTFQSEVLLFLHDRLVVLRKMVFFPPHFSPSKSGNFGTEGKAPAIKRHCTT